MRSSGPILRPRPPRSNSQPQPLNPSQPSPAISQELAIQAALETLDNTHSFMLLQSTYITLPSLLCQRTRLTHLLDQHRNCLEFSARSLSAAPKCTHCLEVLLAHLEEGLEISQSLRKELILLLPILGVQKAFKGVLQLAKLAPGAKNYERLIEELSADRCELSKITVLQGQPNDRKIIAKTHILNDERILFVPLEKLITLQVSRNHPLVQQLYQQRANLKSPKHTQLAVFLLHQIEQGQISPYYQYLLSLPTDFSRFPINYSPSLLQELKGSCFLQIIQAKKSEIQKDYEYVIRLQPSFNRFGLTRFIQTRLIVCSRVFGISIGGIKTDALVPVADMLNHQLPKQTSWFYCDQSRGFVIQSMSQITPGAEIFDSYGQKCNSRFLLNYGFALSNNHHNETLLVRFSPQLTMFPLSYRIRLSRSIQSKCFQEAIGVLRCAVMIQQNDDSDSEEYDIGENARLTPFKSFENQIKAWQLLEGLIRDRLKQYATSIIEDRKLLQTVKGSLRDIIILRKGEKQIFQYYLTMSKKMIRFLQNKENRKVLGLYQAYISTLPIEGVKQQ